MKKSLLLIFGLAITILLASTLLMYPGQGNAKTPGFNIDIPERIMTPDTESNQVIIMDELLDSTPLFLTGNTDTVYATGIIDLGKDGRTIMEIPPSAAQEQ